MIGLPRVQPDGILAFPLLTMAEFTPDALIWGPLVRAALARPLPEDLMAPQDCGLAGSVMKITAADGVVVYVIGEYQADLDVYEARWPD